MQNYKALSRKNFDHQAPIYDSSNNIFISKIPKQGYPFLQNAILHVRPQRLLDIGCGTGEIARLLQRILPNTQIDGVDLSPEMIRQAKNKQLSNAVFQIGDAEKLPYEADTFDMAVCSQSFHHYPNPSRALLEAYRVLKPGGIFLLCDTYVSNDTLRWLENHIVLKLVHTGDVHTYGQDELCRLFTEAGFRNVSWNQIRSVIFSCAGIK